MQDTAYTMPDVIAYHICGEDNCQEYTDKRKGKVKIVGIGKIKTIGNQKVGIKNRVFQHNGSQTAHDTDDQT